MEFGVYTFAELQQDPVDGSRLTGSQRMANLLEEAELADQLGLEAFAIGEHHREDFIVSAPGVVLAAVAARTKNIRLSSAVTVLSSDDPVRVWEEFSTVDLISQGRAEIMAGRGSFTESFPLFGYDLADYDDLFAEKLGLLLELRAGSDDVEWAGRHRAPLHGQSVFPKPMQAQMPIWIAVGGNPESAARAGMLGLPMALAIIGGEPARFAPFAKIHRMAAEKAGQPIQPMSINSHGFIAETSQEAAEVSYPYLMQAMNKIGRERGWQPMTRADFDASNTLYGANFTGSPQQVVEKILYQHEIFRHERFLLQFSIGPIPHDKIMRSIELFGTQVVPAVRAALGERSPV